MNSKIKELQNKKKEIDAQIAEIRKHHYKTQLEGYNRIIKKTPYACIGDELI